MISQLLGEHSWPELEQTLMDFCVKNNINPDAFYQFDAPLSRNMGRNGIAFMINALCEDHYFRQTEGKNKYSVKDLVEMTKGSVDPYHDDMINYIRGLLTLRHFRAERVGKIRDSSKIISRVMEESKSMTTHELYLRAKNG